MALRWAENLDDFKLQYLAWDKHIYRRDVANKIIWVWTIVWTWWYLAWTVWYEVVSQAYSIKQTLN